MPRLFGPPKTPLLRGPDPQEFRETARETREAREPRKLVVPDNRPGPVIAEPSIGPSPARPKPPVQSSLDFKDTYKLPPLDLLKPAPPNQNAGIDKLALERNARLLESVLDDFHVPIVTEFDF